MDSRKILESTDEMDLTQKGNAVALKNKKKRGNPSFQSSKA
jgi:hypothetical protein